MFESRPQPADAASRRAECCLRVDFFCKCAYCEKIGDGHFARSADQNPGRADKDRRSRSGESYFDKHGTGAAIEKCFFFKLTADHPQTKADDDHDPGDRRSRVDPDGTS